MNPGLLAALVGIVLVLLLLAISVRSVGERGASRIMRCSSGHLFTSIVIPGASFKAIRLGNMRYQRCPVGNHWALVRQVDAAWLSEEELAQAARYRDTPIP